MALTKGFLLRSLSAAGFQSTKLTSQLVVPATPLVVQAATITRGPKKWPKYPFPYKRLTYRPCYRLFWRGNGKLVPNESKVVVVEGNAAVGKSAFAKELAERLDFKMFDEPEELFSRYYTWAGQPDDPRAMTPKDAQTYYFPQFFSDPGRNRGACIGLQLELFKLRFFRYCEALNHLYSTGQGVVLVRSPFCDRAFAETYFDLGLLPGVDWRQEYGTFQWRILDAVPTPHLTIYLDAPMKFLIDRIKERELPFEVDNLEFTKEFVGTLDYWYKRIMLPYYEFHGRVLSYSWDLVHDWNGILEDIEAQDLEDVFNHIRFKNWRCPHNDLPAERWSFLSNKKLQHKFFQKHVDRVYFTAGSLWGRDTMESSHWTPTQEVVRKIG